MNDDDWGNEILGVDDWMSILSENVCLRGLGLVWGEILSFLWMRCGTRPPSMVTSRMSSHLRYACNAGSKDAAMFMHVFMNFSRQLF